MIEIESEEEKAYMAATVRIICVAVATGMLAVGWGISVLIDIYDRTQRAPAEGMLE